MQKDTDVDESTPLTQPSPPGQLEIQSATILVVDDEAANVKLLERVLRNHGHANVRSTTDPRTVAPLFLEHAIDLVILDINMPHLNGFQVMEVLRAQNGQNLPPILILTAQSDQEHCVRALREGAHDFVAKPFVVDELMARVRNLLQVQLFQKSIRGRNEWLEERVRERTQALYDTRLQIVRRLGRAAEFRDNETGLHIVRMSKISALLGEGVGLDAETCELLLNASPMHDIGKIGIPDQVLLKPGKLEAQEWEVMKTHATIGAEILSGDDSPLLSMARDIAVTHHEKWDGSGYPNGLAGEDIPLVGRIVALADVFDALTSERPYKKAWSTDAALAYLDEQRSRHFDPRLVDVFVERLPQILAISSQYAEPQQPDT